MRYFLLPLLLVCNQLHAEDVTLTFTSPVAQETCTDAGPLPNLEGIRVYKLVADVVGTELTSIVLPNVLPGTHRYVASAYTDTGAESRASNPTEKITTEFVTIATDVYYVIAWPGTYNLVRIGTIPLGTACNPDHSVNGHYSVPIDEVEWIGTGRPLAVVAQCG